jgi:AraC family transcriptional regulator of adaptative response / DNA-3-methyladenine glycosylase II
MTHATMFRRVVERDATCNGRFFFGVLTTGIYCLPGCTSRQPKSENVRFFPTCEAARAAGLRPCRKCHPDDFARGADPVLADIEMLVAEIRAHPATFADTRAVVRRSGFGATRLFELFRQHYHATPADVLLQARIAQARRALLTTGDGLLKIAHAAGFASASVFHEQFRALNGLTPRAYRELAGATRFELSLPPGYPLAYLRRALSRDRHSLTERLEGNEYTTGLRLAGQSIRLRLTLSASSVVAEFTAAAGPEIHRVVLALLGLEQDAAAFARLARKLGLGRLVCGREGLRIVQTPTVFDGLLWSIIGQQINFAFACQLRRRLTELCGEQLPDARGLLLSPTPAAVAALKPEQLLPLKFSRHKADYLVQAARLVASGALDLVALRAISATRAERTLLAVRGLGPWSVNYLMMRSLGFADCVPLGDTGVTSGLHALLRLEERPDVSATRRLMAGFAPYRSLATAHLWQFTQPVAT